MAPSSLTYEVFTLRKHSVSQTSYLLPVYKVSLFLEATNITKSSKE